MGERSVSNLCTRVCVVVCERHGEGGSFQSEGAPRRSRQRRSTTTGRLFQPAWRGHGGHAIKGVKGDTHTGAGGRQHKTIHPQHSPAPRFASSRSSPHGRTKPPPLFEQDAPVRAHGAAVRARASGTVAAFAFPLLPSSRRVPARSFSPPPLFPPPPRSQSIIMSGRGKGGEFLFILRAIDAVLPRRARAAAHRRGPGR
jgi:hypothetical protein